MAGHEEPAKPGAIAYGTDDLSALLDSLAQEIKDAGSRHSETLHDMHGRVGALSDRASAAKPNLPHEYGAAIDRIEAAMSSFAERLSDAEPQRVRDAAPSDSTDGILPETVRAAVQNAIKHAHRGAEEAPAPARSEAHHPFGESGEVVHTPSTAPSVPAPVAIDPSWLEARFADIAGRVEHSLEAHNPHNALLAIGTRFEQFEQRFDRALHDIGSRPGSDPEALKSVEQQIGELASQLERAQSQLGRLDAIESRLTDLRQSLSEEQMSRLLGALAPADEKLSAIAATAAERVANALRSEWPTGQGATAMVSDPRLVELTAMLDAFIGEQRQGDVQTAEALDTMQQAMQHLIDRVEAIETAQVSNHEALMSERAPAAPREPQVFSVRTPEPDAAAMPEDPVPAPVEPPFVPEALSELAVAPPLPEPLDSLRADPKITPPPLSASPSPAGGELDRLALIAMARRAAEKVSNKAPPASRAPAGRSLPRPGILLVASFAAFLLAGFWLVAGPSLSRLIPSLGLTSTRSGDATPAIVAPARAATPSEERPSSSPQVERTAEHDAGTEGDEARPTERVQKTSLPAPEALPPAPRPAVTTTTADLIGALNQSVAEPASAPVPQKPEMPAMSRAVEMPPAMLGPLSLRHAAAKGDPRAQFEVAARYAEGKGIPQDFAQAATWYQRAAAQGLASAQYRLGALYERGLGVGADPARARVWYSRAADLGNLRAMHNLAVLSAGRPGVRPDYHSAIQWFTAAADRGLADSQYNLGILYESGLGVPANNIEAYKWYALAARSGDKDATKRRDIVRSKLDPQNVKAADALVIQWRAKPVEADANDARMPGQTWQAVRR